MSLQYISDEQGRHTAVIIPIEEWNEITARYQDLKLVDALKSKPSDFRGAISDKTADALLRHTEQARTEWGNDTF